MHQQKHCVFPSPHFNYGRLLKTRMYFRNILLVTDQAVGIRESPHLLGNYYAKQQNNTNNPVACRQLYSVKSREHSGGWVQWDSKHTSENGGRLKGLVIVLLWFPSSWRIVVTNLWLDTRLSCVAASYSTLGFKRLFGRNANSHYVNLLVHGYVLLQ